MCNENLDAGEVALVGIFDPASIVELMAPEAAAQIAGISSMPGVCLHHLAAGLVSREIRTTLIGGVRGATAIHVKSNPLSVAIYGKRGGWPYILNGLHRERRSILALLQKINPSIVHANWTFEGGRAVADWGGPKLLTVHDAAWECVRLGKTYSPGGVVYAARWLMETGATLARFKHIIAVSPYVEAYLRIRHHFRGEIRVIPNAIPELPETLAVSGTFPKTKVITFGCYGPPSGLRNVPVALSAFSKVESKIEGSRMLVFGGGWAKAKAQFRKHRIDFRGALPHPEFLKALAEEVDIWVHPSRCETHSLVICEAIQAGCVVIGGRLSGAVPWTLDYGNAGVLVDIEDANEVASAMRTAVLERSALDGMVAFGRNMVMERFCPSHVLDQHLMYYKDILASDHMGR